MKINEIETSTNPSILKTISNNHWGIRFISDGATEKVLQGRSNFGNESSNNGASTRESSACSECGNEYECDSPVIFEASISLIFMHFR